MTASCRRFLAGAFVVLLLVPGARANADGTRYSGRPVIDVLLEPRKPGLDFIDSWELVPAAMPYRPNDFGAAHVQPGISR